MSYSTLEELKVKARRFWNLYESVLRKERRCTGNGVAVRPSLLHKEDYYLKRWRQLAAQIEEKENLNLMPIW